MSAEVPINWPVDGLVPAVIQDDASSDVLMVGFMNEYALDQTRSTGLVHFWSRSRKKLWKKGETSGHVQHVHDILVNCEQNSVLIKVRQEGAVCHDGYPTCYYRRLEADNSLVTVREQLFDPKVVYGDFGGAEVTVQRWWGAYEFLHDTDLEDRSGTSRAIRDREKSVVPRIQDELHELAGVLDGSHVHTNQRDDAILEASQVCYWTALEAIRLQLDWNDLRPDRAIAPLAESTVPEATALVELLHEKANQLTEDDFSPRMAHDVFRVVASTCRALGIEPLAPVVRDLRELEERDYLSPYFAR